MNPKATISCSCGCMFQATFQNGSSDIPPQCPQCKAVMDKASWKSLWDSMASLADFNYHVLKWNAERNEPRMLVPAITVSTLVD